MIEKAKNRTSAMRYHKMTAIPDSGRFWPEFYVRNGLLPQIEGDLRYMEVDLRYVEEVFFTCYKNFLQEHPTFSDRSLY